MRGDAAIGLQRKVVSKEVTERKELDERWGELNERPGGSGDCGITVSAYFSVYLFRPLL